MVRYKVLRFCLNHNYLHMLTLNATTNRLLKLAGTAKTLASAAAIQHVLQTALVSTATTMRERIHQQGLAADNTAFASPSAGGGYLVHSGRLKNEWTALPPAGLGWRDPQLTQRALHLEQRYGKTIWRLRAIEKEALCQQLEQETARLLKQT